MKQEQFKELLRSQQGELNAVLMYQRLAKVVKTEKERDAFLQLAKECFPCLHQRGFETKEDNGCHHAITISHIREKTFV